MPIGAMSAPSPAVSSPRHASTITCSTVESAAILSELIRPFCAAYRVVADPPPVRRSRSQSANLSQGTHHVWIGALERRAAAATRRKEPAARLGLFLQPLSSPLVDPGYEELLRRLLPLH